MIRIEIIHEFPYIEVVINMESEYGFNREVIITDRITSTVTRRHGNKVSNFEIEDFSGNNNSGLSSASSESRYAKISFRVSDEPSHLNWIALTGLSLALFSTIQGICESISMYLGIDHSDVSEHRSIPAFGHLILAYLFLFNAAIFLALWFFENVFFIFTVWGVSIISWILSTWLMLNNYGMNILQLIWKAFQDTSSTYDKIMVASWTRTSVDGLDKFVFPDWRLVGLACAQNGSVLCINLLLLFCVFTAMAMLIDFQKDLKDSASSSSVSPIPVGNISKNHVEKKEKRIWIFGIIGGLLVFFGMFANFSLFSINNLYISSNVHQHSHPYEVYTGGPRYAMFFGFVSVGLLSISYFMTHSKWAKFILFICSIVSLGCAIYSVFALGVWYEERLSEDGVYTDIRYCSLRPHQENKEFCVFNCTFVHNDNSNLLRKSVVCKEVCIPIGNV